jgi:anti-anti-sigma factor
LAFTYRVHDDEGALVVTVYGEMDLNVSDSFEMTVRRIIAQQRPAVLQIDLSDLRLLDSTAVSAIVRLWRLARRACCSLRVVNPTGVVRHVLEVTGALAIVGGVAVPQAAARRDAVSR